MLLAPETWPFTVATFLLLLVAIVEGIALLFGTHVSSWLDHALDHPLDHVEGTLDRALSWLYVGRVPILVLIVIFLAGFAMFGFALNIVVHRLFGIWAPVWAATPFALVATLPLVRAGGAAIAHIIPKDESFAVTLDTLVGRVATIIGGNARRGYPAQARVANEHGKTLYVMVEPDDDSGTLENGTSVLLVRQIAGTRFSAIRNPRPDLL